MKLHNPNVNWKSIFRSRKIRDHPATQVSIHYPRLFFYSLLLSIPLIVSICLVFLQDIYHTNGQRNIASQGAAFDYTFGAFWFSYRFVDLDSTEIIYEYGTDWHTYSYFEYCKSVSFATSMTAGPLIDTNFFCDSKMWRFVQVLQGLACFFGVMFLIVLLDNIKVWSGYSWIFRKLDLSNNKIRIVRRLFKFLININVIGHLVCQTISLYCIFQIKQQEMITFPQIQSFYFGTYFAALTVVIDVVFILLFSIFDKLLFFHQPYPEDHEVHQVPWPKHTIDTKNIA
ncbi:hypothetical protein HDV01_003774 [Terramyces sp. JEL0728]|nr:hypothetical protein HDV01_003774 [Terramyces sp. JEL0728]